MFFLLPGKLGLAIVTYRLGGLAGPANLVFLLARSQLKIIISGFKKGGTDEPVKKAHGRLTGGPNPNRAN